MIEISAQILNGYNHGLPKRIIVPTPEEIEKCMNYKENQIVRAKVRGTMQARSIPQLGQYQAICRKVASNTDNPGWNTREKVDFQCRVATGFRDENVVAVSKDGMVQFRYKSIAFRNLEYADACKYFTKAYKVMAEFLGVSVDELLAQH